MKEPKRSSEEWAIIGKLFPQGQYEEEWCFERYPPQGGPYSGCARQKGHSGPHVAFMGGKAYRIWEDDLNDKTTEECAQ